MSLLLLFLSSTPADDHNLTANGVKSTGIVGKPSITQDHAATPLGVKSTGTVGRPTLTQEHSLVASGVKSTGTVGAPAITQDHALSASGVKSEDFVGSPAVTQDHSITANGIKSQSTVGAPALTQDHALSASGVKSEDFVGKPAITQDHSLVANGVKSTGTVGAPALTESIPNTDLEALGVKSTIIVGKPALTQNHDLTAAGVSATGRVGSPLLTSPEVAWTPGGFFGFGSPVQKVGDTRWEGVRAARERARAAFDDLPATRVAKRKEAAVRASEAVAEVAKIVGGQKPAPVSVQTALDPVADQLDLLLADLAGLIEQDQIRAQEARDAAAMWEMIDRELRAMQAEEEELMLVLALAL